MKRSRRWRYWTFRRLQEEARKYDSRKEFQAKSPNAYSAAVRKGWIKKVCSGMKRYSKPSSYWTFERVAKAAKRCKNRSSFRKSYPGAYQRAWREGWLDKVCRNMSLRRLPNGHWSFDRCRAEALKYGTRTKFRLGSPSAYGSARRNGWLDSACRHMHDLSKPKNYWTYERVRLAAKRFDTRTSFCRNISGAYDKAQRMGWLDRVCCHME